MSSKIQPCSFDEVIEKHWPEGIKKTRQRVDIYKVLYNATTPLSAAEIFSMLNNSQSGNDMYAFSTIYRNLLAFEKTGIILKSVLSTEGNALYELKRENHRHYAVCLKCHTKIPISSCPLHDIAHDLTSSIPDFEVTGHQLEIYGYCNECKKTLH